MFTDLTKQVNQQCHVIGNFEENINLSHFHLAVFIIYFLEIKFLSCFLGDIDFYKLEKNRQNFSFATNFSGPFMM